MKQLIRSMVISSLVLVSFGAAAECSAPPQGGMKHGAGMMGGMSEAQQEQHIKMMQEYMLAVQDLGNKILAEQDLAKKEELKTQQLQLMKTHHAQMMGMMHGGGMKH